METDKVFKWGIIGPGKIARKFAAALQLVPDASLHAVASRDGDKASAFASEFNAAVFYNSYEMLAADPVLDAVYIATPHSFHHAHAMLCLAQKKAVLCEKPMSVTAASTAEMINAAKKHNVFLMEAMWTRFLPTIAKTMELIAAGEIGEIKHLAADFGFVAPFDPAGRLFDLKLGGGSLLDVGVYPLFLALLVLGKPDQIKTFARLTESGADETTSAMLFYKNGAIANILSSVGAQTPICAEISGTGGSILLDRPWYKGATLRLRKNDTITDTFHLPFGDNGFEFQIQEVQACLQRKQIESSLMSHDFSLLLGTVMDTISSMNKVKYTVQPA